MDGVENGAFYNSDVAATFSAPAGETYEATLDDEPYTSGTTITGDGEYTLVVTARRDDNRRSTRTTIVFTIDTVAPEVVAITRVDGLTYQVKFNEPIAKGSDTEANYVLGGECAAALGNPLTAALDASLESVQFTLDEPGCVAAETFEISVSNLEDRAGNAFGTTGNVARYAPVGTLISAILSTDQEVTAPTGTMATTGGVAALALTPDGLEYAIKVTDLSGDITAAHIHRAGTGVDGGVAHDIMASFDGTNARGRIATADLTDEDMKDLLLGDLYLNIHTATNTGGEIRGQIFVESAAHFSAALTTDQEVTAPTGAGNASGTASVRLSKFGLAYEITVNQLSGAITAAHIHSAPVGENGDVVLDIMASFDGNTARGVWLPDDTVALDAARIKELLLGGLYFNIHTAANGGGELRGQIIPSAGELYEALLEGSQEVPAVTTDAKGSASLMITDAGVIFDITANGLSGAITAAHLHAAPAGMNGPPVRTIDLTKEVDGNTARGVWMSSDPEPLTADLLDSLKAGDLYINLHTAANEGGEIRGQLGAVLGDGFVASFTGAQENPAIAVEGTGSAKFSLSGFTLNYDITVDGLTGAITAAHIHTGATGINGGVAHDIASDFDGNTASGSVTLTPTQLDDLLSGRLYVNIHTAANGSGEVRGQIRVASGVGLSAHLTGAQENPPVAVDATGVATATLLAAGVAHRATATGLSGAITAAHLHDGAIGVNGDVVVALTFTEGTAEESVTLTAEQSQKLQDREVYYNIHTAANGSGEIRGQAIRATRKAP